MRSFALFAVMLTTSVVQADERDPLDAHAPGNEPDGYVSGGVVLDGTQGYVSSGIMVDVGKRLGSTPWFARVEGQGGTMHRSDEPGRGSFVDGRIGVEARTCTYGGMACGSAGVDVGIHRADFTHVTFANNQRLEAGESLDATVAVPRLTLDAGGRIRFRVTVELPLYMRDGDMTSPAIATQSTQSMTAATGDHQFAVGLAISAALAVGF